MLTEMTTRLLTMWNAHARVWVSGLGRSLTQHISELKKRKNRKGSHTALSRMCMHLHYKVILTDLSARRSFQLDHSNLRLCYARAHRWPQEQGVHTNAVPLDPGDA